jgi:hypothetical protein
MTWFKVDDNLAFHPKTLAAGNAAIGLWVRAGSWSAQQLSDGYVPADIVRSMAAAPQAERLVSAGLWVPYGGGFQFHQWTERQPTRGDVEKRRRAGAERLRQWREQQR